MPKFVRFLRVEAVFKRDIQNRCGARGRSRVGGRRVDYRICEIASQLVVAIFVGAWLDDQMAFMDSNVPSAGGNLCAKLDWRCFPWRGRHRAQIQLWRGDSSHGKYIPMMYVRRKSR